MTDGVRVFVLGAAGMLGHKLCQELSPRLDVFGSIHGSSRHTPWLRNLLPDGRLYENIDAFDLGRIEEILDDCSPHAVINAIGIVKQRDEAKEAVPAIRVNALFPHLLADICSSLQIRLIHISTDCVFSGAKGSYTESDLPDPVDLYGRTKLLGELTYPGCLTLRTSIIGWELSGRSSLLEWFASQRGRHIKGYQQAIYSGFSSTVVAGLIGDIVETRPDLSGLYQVASKPISKYDLLVKLRAALAWDDVQISPDSQFFCDRSLIGLRFEKMTGWTPPVWEEMIAGLAEEWPQYAARRETSA